MGVLENMKAGEKKGDSMTARTAVSTVSVDRARLAKGDRLYEAMQMWIEGVKWTRNGYLRMGEAIHIIKKEGLWRYEVEHMPTFKYWVEKSLHVSVAQAHRLEQIYREVGSVLADGSISIDISKITLLLPYLTDKDDDKKREMLTSASECTVEDVRNNILDLVGHSDRATDVCSHLDTELITRCRKCGKFFR